MSEVKEQSKYNAESESASAQDKKTNFKFGLGVQVIFALWKAPQESISVILQDPKF